MESTSFFSSLLGLHAACLASRVLMHEVDRLSVADFRTIIEGVGLELAKLDERLAQQINGKGDILVLPQLTLLGVTADVAWVRQVWQVPLKDIVFRTSELKPGMGQRIARLDSPYRYRLTQLMAQVFSDIGLPNSARNLKSELINIV